MGDVIGLFLTHESLAVLLTAFYAESRIKNNMVLLHLN